ncbi:hypothetical protein E2542_SST01965 [Spatholobus suberectus]|nr:hypothetical protein E2542_SST01965 [Spatholobus suberectus]
MNQVQRINYWIESRTNFELVWFIASPTFGDHRGLGGHVGPLITLTRLQLRVRGTESMGVREHQGAEADKRISKLEQTITALHLDKGKRKREEKALKVNLTEATKGKANLEAKLAVAAGENEELRATLLKSQNDCAEMQKNEWNLR